MCKMFWMRASEYWAAFKNQLIDVLIAVWMDLKNVLLTEKKYVVHVCCVFDLHELHVHAYSTMTCIVWKHLNICTLYTMERLLMEGGKCEWGMGDGTQYFIKTEESFQMYKILTR